MIIDWRLSDLMKMRGLRSTRALHRLLIERVGETPGLSQAQVYRLAEDGPARLNLATLGALCSTLDTTPADLLTSDIAGVPNRLLDTLLAGFAQAAAHNNLCTRARYEAGKPNAMMNHPGDSFGKVLSWLWRSGRHHKAVVLAADFLSEMRQHNPYAPEPGQRLTWADLRIGVGQAVNTPYDLSAEELNELCDHLETNIPSYYGTSLAELNTA